MSDFAAHFPDVLSVEQVLHDELVHGDALIGTIGPILRHLLANDEHSVFGDEILARVRGMMTDLAWQLFDAVADAGDSAEGRDHALDRVEALVRIFMSDSRLLGHVHALALEWQLTERLEARLALDPVLSPLLQALIASPEPVVASSAMALMAAQARFVQSQRRMQLPLGELPGELLHPVLLALRGQADGPVAAKTEDTIRRAYDESRSRLGLISRIVMGMGGGATAALSLTHSGVAIFLSALAMASGQDRDMMVLATNEGQLARLALALRAAGLKPAAVEEQFMALHPDVTLPHGLDRLGTDRAAALLAGSAAVPGG